MPNVLAEPPVAQRASTGAREDQPPALGDVEQYLPYRPEQINAPMGRQALGILWSGRTYWCCATNVDFARVEIDVCPFQRHDLAPSEACEHCDESKCRPTAGQRLEETH